MPATKTTPKAATAPKATRAKATPKAAPKATAKKTTRAPKAKAAAPTTGPRKETLDFAARVVRFRDRDGLAWKAVAAKLDVPYDQNGSSRLRRAYTLGGGKTVGARAAKAAPKTTRRARKA